MGLGGIGKTSLAIELGYRCLPGEPGLPIKPFEAVVWVSAREYLDFDLRIHHVLDTIGQVLDCGYLAQLSIEAKVRAVNDLLRSHRTLVIADNFETVKDEELVRFLEHIPEPSKALITTRYFRYPDVVCLLLGGLKDEETLTLIRSHSRRLGLGPIAEADDRVLHRLVVATQNNPKAVQLALGLIRKKGLPFYTVVEELQQAGQAVREIFDYIFAEAWKLLAPEARQVLLAMSLFVSSVSRTALSTVAGVQGEIFDQAMEQLVTMSLLEVYRTPGLDEQRYSVHPLTRAFIKSKSGIDKSSNVITDLESPTSEITHLKSRFWTFFVNRCETIAGYDYWSIISWKTEVFEELYREMPNLLLSLEWAWESEDWATVLPLVKVIIHPIYLQGQVDQRIRCCLNGIEAAKKLEQVEDQIWLLLDGLGLVYHQSGLHKETKACAVEGLQLARTYGFSDAVALGEVLLSYEAIRTCQLDEAQKHISEALQYADRSYFKYRAYRAAGHLARHQYQYEEAEACYLQAAKYLEGTTYRSTIDLYLGLTNFGLKRYEQAQDYFQRALRLHQNYGNQRVIARAKLGLALTYTAQAEQLGCQIKDLVDDAYEVFSRMNLHRELEQTKELMERLSEPFLTGGI